MNPKLSNIELYYSKSENAFKEKLLIEGEESSHIIKVMRHSLNDVLFVTNGSGKIFRGKVSSIKKDKIELITEKILSFENQFSNLYFCIPKLKSQDRFEFTLEKCTELGVTNFLIFESERTVSKSSRTDRWNKVVLAAMKQSLRSYLPKIELIKFEKIFNLEGEKIGFEQTAGRNFQNFQMDCKLNYYFIFGPEGGLSGKELNLFKEESLYYLSENRLRTETAVIKCASLLK